MKKLKNKYEELSIKPNERAWEKIEQKLDKKPMPVLWKGVAAVLLIMMSLSIFLMKDNERQKWVQKSPPKLIEKKKLAEQKVAEKYKIEEEHLEEDPVKKEYEIISYRGPASYSVPPPHCEFRMNVERDTAEMVPKTQYTTAEDLLFGVEAQRLHTEPKSKTKMGSIDLPTISEIEPHKVEILGVKIYEK